MKVYTLGYALLRALIKIPHKLFYNKIEVVGQTHIPKDKPIIFAPNHQNALMDPLAMIFSTPKQTVFLARGDIFSNKTISTILHFMKIKPVYRQQQNGKSSLYKNKTSFTQSVQYLEDKGSFCLFPEAKHNPQRNLLPLKKGIPRIAFQALKRTNNKIDIKIIPTGIYYDNKEKSYSYLRIEYGKPISVQDYIEQIKRNEQKAMLELVHNMEKAIRPLIIDIPNDESYNTIDKIRILFSDTDWVKKATHTNNSFKNAQYLIEQSKHKNIKNTLKKNIEQLHQTLETKNWSPTLINKDVSLPLLVLKSILLILTLPIFIIGLIINLPLYVLAQLVRTKMIKDKQFISTVNFVVGGVLSPIYFLLLSLITAPFFGLISVPINLVVLPILSYLSYYISKKTKTIKQEWSFHISKEQKNTIKTYHNVSKQLQLVLTN